MEIQQMMEMLARIDASMKTEKEERRKDKEDFLVKLESSQEKANIMLATLYADRKTDKDDMLKEMKAMQENTKTDKEDLMAKLDANQEKAAADKEELKALMQSMRTELDDKIEHRVENILAIVEHDKETLRSEITEQIEVSLCAQTDKIQEELMKTCAAIEETQRDFQARLDVVQTRTEQGITPTIVASTAQPPTFNGNSTWSVFRRQFETVAEHNQWSEWEKSTYLITALKGRAAEILPGIPANTTYEETLQALEDRFGDQHFAAAYHCQLRMRMQRPGESLQDFATAIELLSHRAYPNLPADHIGREAGKAFAYGI
ncbi:hypothetical protein B7P43_G13239 [Cryptotermes secundus]|uniref:Paraneoplastic antigen Ma-like C-terminal domain-containing protein n=1 Tax=Cryptotermes secundus TaxID=105785 RepID=A0A2J7R0R8_9NEOP|nr:hypothetical protein B7P43_G13239 [Cryptotermes secundus]